MKKLKIKYIAFNFIVLFTLTFMDGLSDVSCLVGSHIHIDYLNSSRLKLIYIYNNGLRLVSSGIDINGSLSIDNKKMDNFSTVDQIYELTDKSILRSISVQKKIKERKSLVLDILENNCVTSLESYKQLMGELDALNYIAQELSGLLEQQELSND